MPGRGKKTVRKHSNGFGDLTINDYANATKCTNRPKKSFNNVTHYTKRVQVAKNTETNETTSNINDTPSWDERTDEYYDFDFVEQIDEDGIKVVSTRRRKFNKNELVEDKNENETGAVYPIDIWYLISQHIRPEDVQRFSLICRSTSEVVSSAKFWFYLYRKHYNYNTNLPERLQPECMVRFYGLKACVTRALFYLYPPFVSRTKRNTNEEHPHTLVKRQCVLMYHSKQKNKWSYNFKLKSTNPFRNELKTKPDLLEMLDDVFANTEENCRLLQIQCPHFVQVPLVTGLTLCDVSLTLSQGFRNYRLKLNFGSGLSYAEQDRVEVIFDPIVSVKILDWWHPLYPHCQTTPSPVDCQE